jgi:hypothetical protein
LMHFASAIRTGMTLEEAKQEGRSGSIFDYVRQTMDMNRNFCPMGRAIFQK